MPKIPQYNRQVSYPARLGAPMANFRPRYGFWTAEGRAIAGAGEDVERAAAYWEKLLEERQQHYDATVVLDTESTFGDEARQFLDEEKAKIGKDAFGAVQRGEEWYRDTVPKYLKKLENPRQREYFQKFILQRRETDLNSLGRHELSQEPVYRRSATENVIFNAREDARADPLNDERIESAITKAKGAIASLYPGLETAHVQAEQEQNIRAIAIQSMLQNGEARHAAQRLELWKDRLTMKQYDLLKAATEEALSQNNEDAAYGFLKKRFGNNYDAAIEYLTEPGNYEKLGLDLREARYVKSILVSDQAADQRANEELTKELVQNEAEQIYQLIREGNSAGARRALDNAVYISSESKLKVQEALDKAQWSTSPTVKALVEEGIRRGDITSREQVLPYLGNGLSHKDYDSALSLIDETKEFHGQLNYFDMAMKWYNRFVSAPAGNAEDFFLIPDEGIISHWARADENLARLANLRGEYSATLSWLMKKNNLTQNDPEVFELGKKLVQEVVVSGAISGWRSWFNEERMLLEVLGERKPWLTGADIETEKYFDVDILDATQEEVQKVHSYLNMVNRPLTRANKRAVLERGRAGLLGRQYW